MVTFKQMQNALNARGYLVTSVTMNTNESYLIKSAFALFLFNVLRKQGLDVKFNKARDLLLVDETADKILEAV